MVANLTKVGKQKDFNLQGKISTKISNVIREQCKIFLDHQKRSKLDDRLTKKF